MEAFTLLKYWRGGGAALGNPPSSDTPTSRAATTILTAVENENATESSDDDDNEDEGPFFDLEFTVPDEEAHENPNTQEEEEEESDGSREFNLTLSPSSNERSNLFFKGKLVHVDPSSKPQFTASLLKSATKFRVFMLGLKKPKPTDKDSNRDKKLFTVKFKVEEVPIVSLFSSKGNKTHKQTSDSEDQPSPSPSEDKQRFSKEVMQKYFKMVKPLYIRVSRRYSEKLSLNPAGKSPATAEPQGAAERETNVKSSAQKLPAGLSVVCKHLGKSRSASSAVAAAPPPPPFVSSKRRDDSLLQQQDGIQGAILHCKRSFNASRDECESSQLPRSVSHPSHEISMMIMNEGKDKRL